MELAAAWVSPAPVVLDSQGVDTLAQTSGHSLETSVIAKIGWGALIVVTLYICYFSHLGAIGFVGPDEPRYAWIARDMMETGDWVTPRLYGKPWFEKPPLLYWEAGLCFKWFGVSETAARLPSAISALLATLALAWLALRLYGAETARWLLLLLPTTAGMIGFSHAAATDMPFSGTLTIAMVCAAAILGLTRNENTPILPSTPWLALVLFGFFLGLAVLAKGPAAIVLCGGAVFLWALLTKRWRDALRLLHPVGIVAFCATAMPWYIACARRNPDFFRIFIIEHNFQRYLTPEFQHIQPFWFYVPVLLVAFLPWTALLLWSSIHGVIQLWRTRCAKESAWFLLCWAIFCVLFFSASQSKLPGYILPALPAIALLISHLYVSQAAVHRKSFRLLMVLASFLFFALLATIIMIKPHVLPGDKRVGVIAAAIFGLLAAANLLLAFDRASQKSFFRFCAPASILPALLAVLLIKDFIEGYFPWDPSGRGIARELKSKNIPASELAVGELDRGRHYGLNFYLHEEIQDWNRENSYRPYVLTTTHTCRTLDPVPLACEPLPFYDTSTAAFLYHVVMPGLARGPDGDRGQVQKKE